MTNAAEDLLGHMEWADALIWRTVLASSQAQDDRIIQDRLYHIHVTQHAFLQVWRGLAEEEMPAANTLDVVALAQWGRAFYVVACAERSWLDADALGRGVPDSLASKAQERLGTGAARPAIIDTIYQVVLHSTYHRGQVSARLREVGSEPPLLEYFVWAWWGKPAADWPEAISESAPS